MKRVSIFIICVFCISNYASGQNPLVKIWDYRFGGTSPDYFRNFIPTSDGGFVLSGFTSSGIGGDKSQNSWGDYDYWIVKTDSVGNKLWDKDFGGVGMDALYSIQQTSDGGYILGGYSTSNISGDKTQDTKGGTDYWIVKIDSLGNKQWDKDFGGTSLDYLISISQTFDGGYIMGGYSISGIGGDKTQNNMGGNDYWIVKTDPLGNKIWDKNFGGTSGDALLSLDQTDDGGYILGGSSDSDIGGDKSQNTNGGRDYWIIKLDSLGVKQWDKDFGGVDSDDLISLMQTTDKGYILGGLSNSIISGDKTENTWGLLDFWILKIDSLGNKQWDRDFGGTGDEEFSNILQTSDGGYLISGDSYSPISGNKSEANMGQEQTWVVKTDSLGNISWDKTVFTPGHDENGFAIRTIDGCYLMANQAQASGGYKTQVSQGGFDYWMVKFCEALQAGFTAPAYLCPGTCIDFTNISFSASGYQWFFPGASPDTSTAINPANICYTNPGSYDVTLIAANANGSDTLFISDYITVYPQPAPQGIMQSGDTLFANQGATSYQWFYNGSIISGATDYFFVASQSGDYNVVAIDNNGCEVEAVINDVIANLDQLPVGSWELAIVPNPVTTTLDVRGLEKNSPDEIKIFNVFGEKIFSVVNCKLPITNCQLFPPGLYYLEISADKKVYRAKFIKQ